MKFTGISKVFSTVDEKQYVTIGAFWDEMAARYSRSNLKWLGYHWSDDSIEYVIGLKDGVIDGTNCEVSLPDEGWQTVCGKTKNLGELYSEIYKEDVLQYEIEMFDDEGNCQIMYYR